MDGHDTVQLDKIAGGPFPSQVVNSNSEPRMLLGVTSQNTVNA